MRSFLSRVVGVVIVVGSGPAGSQPAPPPAAVVPTELTAAPPWIARNFRTGLIVRKHTHETQTLRRHGLQALLTIEERTAEGMNFDIGPWTTASVKTYLGTATEKAKVVTLKLTNVVDPTDVIDLPCRNTTIAVARPTAVRVATIPAHKQECGDEGRFKPRTTRKLTVLRCLPFDDKKFNLDDETTWTSAPHLAFAPAPGIEWLYVNDDCLQGGGWRQAPANGSIHNDVR